MNVMDLTKKLMSFRSVSADNKISAECIDFIIDYVSDNKKIIVKVEESNGFKSILLSNIDTLDLDVLEVGHIDVVPVGSEDIFNPRIEGDILYGRGSSDMKSFIAVSIENLKYVIENNLNLKYGVLIVSDEEIGGKNGSEYWSQKIGLTGKIILDSDTGKNLNTIIQKTKGAIFVTLVSKGENAHGSMPWLSSGDAIENILLTIGNLRKIFPYYNRSNDPKDKWVETMHVGIISGGKATNAISDYAEAKLDIRFTEKYDNEKILEIIKKNIVGDIEIVVDQEGQVVFTEIDNKYLKLYKDILEKYIGEPVKLDFATGASDSRYFAKNALAIICNQADCGELHSDGEWLNIKKLQDFVEVRKEFLKNLVI